MITLLLLACTAGSPSDVGPHDPVDGSPRPNGWVFTTATAVLRPPVGSGDPPAQETAAPVEVDPRDIVPATVRSAGTVVCESPERREEHPFDAFTPGRDWLYQPFSPLSSSLFVGAGIAIADLNADGLLDVVTTSNDGRPAMLEQTEGLAFRDVSSRLPALPARTSSIIPVDIDGDGDLDLHVTAFEGPDAMLVNQGDGLFFNTAGALGLSDNSEHRTMAASWADVDRDGDLDAFVSGYGPFNGPAIERHGDPSRVMQRQADGTYTDQLASHVEPDPLLSAHTFMGAWHDVNDDGYPEVYLVDDFGQGWPSLLASNHGGALSYDGPVGCESNLENMGVAVGDLNGDEVMDFFVSAWDRWRLFESSPGGLWFETSQARGLFPDIEHGQNVAWGTDFGDLDNDGDLDLGVAFGYLQLFSLHNNPPQQPDAVFEQTADGTFIDRAAEWGLADPGRNRSTLWVDLNRDGWLDLVRTDLRAQPTIHLGRCGDDGWLEVEVHQPGMNRFAIGARVRVVDGDQTWVRDVTAGGVGFASAIPAEVHVGLGDRDRVDRVEVRWPDGTWSVMEDVPTRQRLTITRDTSP